jgi:hypothetical protein
MSFDEDSSIMALGWDSALPLCALRQAAPATEQCGRDDLHRFVHVAASWKSIWIVLRDMKLPNHRVSMETFSAADASV